MAPPHVRPRFSLVVDDFGIKYTRKADADHLVKCLREDYDITKAWTGEKYLGLTLKWDYVNRNVSFSMPGYVKAALLKFQRKATTKPQDAPHRWNQPTYGTKTQYAHTDKADLLNTKYTLYVQQVCGTFLYYTIAVDQTMLVALNDISASQAHATTTTMGDIISLLNYASRTVVDRKSYHGPA